MSNLKPSLKPKKKHLGFTLIELLVVIVIIGLLVAYIAPRFFGQLNNSEQKTAKAQIESIGRALDAYRIDVGSYPNQSVGIGALQTNLENSAKWNGPYLQKATPNDPWGNPYQYTLESSQEAFQITSFGKDGRPGGEGVASDITYR